ncbi:MAG: class A beta-lactamase-related serine hydrolase [Cyclobacteriaceae bacterium]|nr:class A beta-lactamase-related serine hydrolase [Cyclobacteriaceae bacterium]
MIRPLIVFCLLIFSCTVPKETNTIGNLKIAVEEIFNTTKGDFAFAFVDLSNPSNQLLINEKESFHAASTMKTPVMIELYRQASEGQFSLQDSILIKNSFKSIVDSSSYSMDIGEDSQEGLYNSIGDSTTIYHLMYEMITKSSNLATNILIELVDAKKVTTSMRTLGANKIEVLRGVEDQKAYDQGLSNSTTAYDLMVIMKAIAEGTAAKNIADNKHMIEVLKNQKWNDMIPRFLPPSVEVAHKTGSITALHHDSAIVFLPGGKKYVLILLSKNLDDFDEGTTQLAHVSRLVYDFMDKLTTK